MAEEKGTYEAIKVTAEIIVCPGERGLTKHHRCRTFVQVYDCDNHHLQSGRFSYKPPYKKGDVIDRVCSSLERKHQS